MIINWIRKKLAVRSSRKLVRTVRWIIRKRGGLMPPREADNAQVRILACEEAIKRGSLHEIRASRKALWIFFEDNLSSYGKSALRRNAETLVIAVLAALLIRAFAVQPFKIPSGSMLPTLLVGDHILVNKFVYGTKIPFTDEIFFPFSKIDRGDIIVFKLDQGSTIGSSVPAGSFYIKRTVGVAGDEIDIRGRDVFINGRAVEQNYTGNYEYPDRKSPSGNGGFKRPANDMYKQSLSGKEFSVIYEKGNSSTTSGKMNFPLVVPKGRVFVMGDNRDNSYDSRFWGFVSVENVYGKAFMIHWSWNPSHSDPIKKVRWGRITSAIK